MNNVVLKKAIVSTIWLIGISCSCALQAASFDCSKASTNVEKLICIDAIISQQDEQLELVYKAALGKIVDKESLRRGQRIWLKEKRNTCKDAMCLMQVYHERIAQLNSLNTITLSEAKAVQESASVPAQFNLPKSETPSAGRETKHEFPLKFKLVEGDSYPLCQPYVDMLNKTHYMEYPACERKLLPEFKQFKSIEWIEITDKKEIGVVLKNLADINFSRRNKLNSTSHNEFLTRIKGTIKENKINLFLYGFDIDHDGNQEKIYKEVISNGSSNDCNHEINFKVGISEINTDNAAKHGYFEPYVYMRSGSHNQLFIFDNHILNSMWFSSGRYIELWSSTSYQAECKIDII